MFNMFNKSILILISSNTNFQVLKVIAENLHIRGESVVILYEGSDAALLNKIKVFSSLNNITVFEFNHFLIKVKDQTLWDKVKQLCSSTKIEMDYVFNAYKKDHVKRLRASKQIIRKIKPKALIVSENGISGNYWLTEIARKVKVPVITCPYGHGGQRDLENDLARKKQSNELIYAEGDDGKTVETRYPHWVKKGLFSGVLMYPAKFILALEESGVRIHNPWTIQGGHTDKIAVESEAMYEHYKSEGIDENKLALTGTIYCDLLSQEFNKSKNLMSSFENSTKINPEKTSILISWPPSYHDERGHLCEFQSYQQLVENVFSFLSRLPNTDVTVSLHPAITEQNRTMIQSLGIKASDEYIVNLIPHHDIFITCFSSTIRWAIAARKPIVNYDFYKFCIIDYASAPGMITLDTFEDFKKSILSLVEDNKTYTELATKQKVISHKWGNIDGNNFQRIYSLITKLIKSKKARG